MVPIVKGWFAALTKGKFEIVNAICIEISLVWKEDIQKHGSTKQQILKLKNIFGNQNNTKILMCFFEVLKLFILKCKVFGLKFPLLQSFPETFTKHKQLIFPKETLEILIK